MNIRKIIIVFLIFILAAGVIFYAGRQFIFGRLKAYLIHKVESSIQKGVTIENLGYVPLKGIELAGVTIYKDKLYKEKELYVPNLYIKFSLIKFLVHKTLSPTITLHNLELRNATLDGSFGFSVRLVKKIETAKEALESIQNIWFDDFAVKTGLVNIRNINGSAPISAGSIKISNLRFLLNDEPCALDLEITDPLGEFSSTLKISSSKFNLVSHVMKELEVYKITEIKGGFLNSSFEFIGEFENTDAPILSLYGKADIYAEDIVYFAPAEFKNSIKTLNPEGALASSIYFKGNLKEISACELGVKSEADYLKIGNFKFDKFYMDCRINDGVLQVPILSACPYNGTLAASAQLDLKDESMPYLVNAKLGEIDIKALLENTKLGNRDIKGLLSSEFGLRGSGKNIDTMEGAGNIFISEANLGPAPLLTPLVGNLYGYFQNIFAGLKKIDITRGSSDFLIANRRLSTDNLTLWGDVVSVHARGYIDFDKRLNFEIENKFLEPEEGSVSDVEKTLQNVISQFGKLMGRATLRGTLEKPEWKFEYLTGIENLLKGGVDKILKGIFE